MTYGERSVRTGAAQETVAVLGAGGTMGFAMASRPTAVSGNLPSGCR
jgi:hypothetical protein